MRKILSTLFLALALSVGAYAQTPVQPVDLNTADAATLARVLNGVGPAKAEAIIAYREAHGPFTHIDELVKVKGIGLRTVDLNREVMTVESAAPATTEALAPVNPPAAAPVAVAPRPAGG